MKLALTLILFFGLGLDAAAAATKSKGSWTAPGLKPAAFRKVVVFARLVDDAVKRTLEDSVVQGLKERGTDAVPAHQVLTPEDVASRPAIEAKLRELGADAALVFAVAGQGAQPSSSATLSVGVGIPTSSGAYGAFIGGSVAMGGGGDTTFLIVGIRSAFYALGDEGPRWVGDYTTNLEHGASTAAAEIAALTLKQIKKARVFE